MKNDLTQANISDILLSVAQSQDKETQDRVLDILKDFNHLNKVEEETLQEYINLADEVGGVPKVPTLVARNQNYTQAKYIQDTSLIDYANIFIRNKQKLTMHDIIYKGITDYNNGNISFDDFDKVMQEALQIGAPSKMDENVESNLDRSFYEKLTVGDKVEKGVPFGISCIDEVYRGLLPGDILTIAGFTGSMKTTSAANLAYNAAVLGKNTLYLSLEVGNTDLTFGLLARHSLSNGQDPVTRTDIEQYAKEHKDKFLKLTDSYQDLPGKIRIVDERDISSYSVTAFNEVIDKVNKELIGLTGHGIDIIVLDHIQLLKFNDTKSATNNPYLVVNYYVSYFREKAAREGYAVVLLSQTSRQGYEYAAKHRGEYMESGLAEANELERASTAIVTLFATENGKSSGELTVQIIKNRFGKRMAEPKQAPISPDYFMIGTGVSLESEEVGPVFTDNVGDIYANNKIDLAEMNLEEELMNEVGG